jgi:hypothetical protein
MNKIYICILSLLALSSCYEDKGNYDYLDLSEKIANIDKSYIIVYPENQIIIEPSFLEDYVDGNYTYEWIIDKYNKDYSKRIELDTVKLQTNRAFVFNLSETTPIGIRDLRLRITDVNSSAVYVHDTKLDIRSLYSNGLFILNEKDNSTNFSFYSFQVETVNDSACQYVIPSVGLGVPHSISPLKWDFDNKIATYAFAHGADDKSNLDFLNLTSFAPIDKYKPMQFDFRINGFFRDHVFGQNSSNLYQIASDEVRGLEADLLDNSYDYSNKKNGFEFDLHSQVGVLSSGKRIYYDNIRAKFLNVGITFSGPMHKQSDTRNPDGSYKGNGGYGYSYYVYGGKNSIGGTFVKGIEYSGYRCQMIMNSGVDKILAVLFSETENKTNIIEINYVAQNLPGTPKSQGELPVEINGFDKNSQFLATLKRDRLYATSGNSLYDITYNALSQKNELHTFTDPIIKMHKTSAEDVLYVFTYNSGEDVSTMHVFDLEKNEVVSMSKYEGKTKVVENKGNVSKYYRE